MGAMHQQKLLLYSMSHVES